MRTLVLATLTLSAAVVSAQGDVTEWQRTVTTAARSAQAQLRSNDPKEIAWGAHRAAEYQFRKLIPDMVDVLARTPADGVGPELFAMVSTLLDASVRLNAGLPAPLLQRFATRFPVQTTILLANATEDRAETLLDVVRAERGYRWFAAANMLLDAKPPGFAAALLEDMRWQIVIEVKDGEGRGLGTGVGGGSVGCGIGMIPVGYPPLAVYRFASLPRPGLTVLSTGPASVYYERTVHYTTQFGVSSSETGGPSNEERFRYIAALTGNEWHTLPVVHRSVRWQDSPQLLAAAATARRDLESNYDALLGTLIRANYLTHEEAEGRARPPIELTVVDTRNDRSMPLPAVP